MVNRDWVGGALVAWLACWSLTCAAEPLRIAVVSDLNGSYGSTHYDGDVSRGIAKVIALNPDLVISTGDMVAGQRRHPQLTRPELEAMWDGFDAVVTDPLASAHLPFLVTPGNHDGSAYRGFATEREVYDARWAGRLPDVETVDTSRFPRRYAVRMKDVLLVSLDVTTVGALPDEEMGWLRRILSAQNGKSRATVLFSHLPLWPFTQGRETEIIGDPSLQRLLEEFGVEIYLSGHHHGYYPGVKNDLLFISQACLGSGPRTLIDARESSEKAITLIEIGEDGSISEYALAAPRFDTPIDLKTLPPSIGQGEGRMIRRDLAWPAR